MWRAWTTARLFCGKDRNFPLLAFQNDQHHGGNDQSDTEADPYRHGFAEDEDADAKLSVFK